MIMVHMLRLGAVLFGSSLAIGIAVGTSAQDKPPVTLTARDGSVSVSGELKAVEKGAYVLETDFGEMRLPVENVKCKGIACPVATILTPRFGIHGSGTVGTKLMPNLLRGFARSKDATFQLMRTDQPDEWIIQLTNPDESLLAEIDLRTHGSDSAFEALADGLAEIGMTDRRMTDSDAPVLAAAEIPDLRDTNNETVLGLAGLVVMVHPDNPVRHLTTEELAQIYSGEAKSWAEFGGPDLPIVLNTFGPNSDDRGIFVDRILAPHGKTEAPDALVHSTYEDAVDGARNNLGGIAYASRLHSDGTKVLSIRTSCGLLTAPTDFRIKTEDYVLTQRLYLYTRPGNMHPVAQEFLDWALTDEATPYFVEAGFVDRALESMPLEDMGAQIVHGIVSEPDYHPYYYRKMLSRLRGAERLSTAVHFDFASAKLHMQAMRELDELAAALTNGEYLAKEVMLVGFADSIGQFDQNRRLGLRRAKAAHDYLMSRLPDSLVNEVTLTTLSYGELMPLLCNQSDDGRGANRRVEVWMKRKPGDRGIATASRQQIRG